MTVRKSFKNSDHNLIDVPPQLQTEFNFLLMNITVSELIMSAYGVPVDFVAAFQLGWKLGKEFCLVTGFILTLLGMYSINIFTSIAIYRLIAVHENVSISDTYNLYIHT